MTAFSGSMKNPPGSEGCSASGRSAARPWYPVILFISLTLSLLTPPSLAPAFRDGEISRDQSFLKDTPVGERIAFWAEGFVGTPYDRDPKGEYVTRRVIVADDRVDCMYLTFRAVELALSDTPEGAVRIALDKRFHGKGILEKGFVANYEDRFEYGEDMIESGKWGREITWEVGRVREIEGSRGKARAIMLPKEGLLKGMDRLQSGDLIFFIKDPSKRVVGEIVGHMGIVKVEAVPGKEPPQDVYLIHASGTKARGGAVKKILLKDYLKGMPFIGARLTRF